jgi:hypothetical protein
MFCTKCGTQNPVGSGVCSNCHEALQAAPAAAPAPAPQAPQAPQGNISAAEASAFAGRIGQTMTSAVAGKIVMLLKIIAFVLVGYYVIDAFVIFIRSICDCDTNFCICPSFFDMLRTFVSSVINAAARGITLFAYAIIINYLAAKK